jgi:hypothetical protein
LRVEDTAIKVFGAVVLVVVVVDLLTGRLGLGIVKVLLVERSDAVCALFRVLVGVVVGRGQRA